MIVGTAVAVVEVAAPAAIPPATTAVGDDDNDDPALDDELVDEASFSEADDDADAVGFEAAPVSWMVVAASAAWADEPLEFLEEADDVTEAEEPDPVGVASASEDAAVAGEASDKILEASSGSIVRVSAGRLTGAVPEGTNTVTVFTFESLDVSPLPLPSELPP